MFLVRESLSFKNEIFLATTVLLRIRFIGNGIDVLKNTHSFLSCRLNPGNLPFMEMEGDKETITEEVTKRSYAGIPEANFVDDVDAFMALPENNGAVDSVLKKLNEQHSKYKFMEMNLASKRKRLRLQIPDLEHSLKMIKMLQKQQNSPEDFEAQFLLSDQVYMKAVVPPTDKVCLWLGANVMLEYTLDDAMALLVKNIETAKKNLSHVEHDLDFLRDQFTTTEVNMARVYNWDVKRRQAAKAST